MYCTGGTEHFSHIDMSAIKKHSAYAVCSIYRESSCRPFTFVQYYQIIFIHSEVRKLKGQRTSPKLMRCVLSFLLLRKSFLQCGSCRLTRWEEVVEK